MINKFTYNLVLQHDTKNVAGGNASFGSTGKKSKSRYKGGFEQKNGRPNNTRAYNHDYYIHNKDKWHNGRPTTETTGTANGLYVRAFDIPIEDDGWPEYYSEGGMWYPNVNPYQPGYYINWNNPDSKFYNYEKYTVSQFEKVYGDDAREVAFSNLISPPYDEGQNNRVLYDNSENRYYVMTTDPHAVKQLEKSQDVYTVGDQKIGFYTYEGKDVSSDYFMKEQAAKKLISRSNSR